MESPHLAGDGPAHVVDPEGPPRAEDLEAPAGLLDEVLHATRARQVDRSELDRFLDESSPWRALCRWLGLSGISGVPSKDEAKRLLCRDIARIDALLNDQVNAILHRPEFQKLEASWRGLQYLVGKLPKDATVKLRVLNATWGELEQDLTNALEFDQSQLFRKVYESEFGHPGGQPFGALIGDYEIRHRRGPDHPQDDVEMLERIAEVAAAAFAPFIAGAHPSFFGIDSFTELERSLDLHRTFEQPEYRKWRSLRGKEDARFVGLTLPRILMRLPYKPDRTTSRGFRFREDVEWSDRSRYLWGNSVYAFGGVLIRCFVSSGWVADIRGVRQGPDASGVAQCLDEGGLVADLHAQSFSTDRRDVATKCSTDVIITDMQERELDEMGFMPLCHCYDTNYSAFYGTSSIQQPTKYDEPSATINARMSAMLQYILCVSRFAHFLKVIGRDQIGSMSGPDKVEDFLNRWLRDYTTGSENAGPEVKARYPLREARVQVRERPDSPGSYDCIIHLRPHYQLDQMETTLKFTTELTPARSGASA